MNLRPPVARLDAVVGHLREQEVGRPVVPGRAPARAAAVDLPVPQREDQEVRQPDQHAGDDQLAAVGDVVVQQEVVSSTSEKMLAALTNAVSAIASAPAAACARARAGAAWRRQARSAARLERREQPRRAHRQARGQHELQRDRRAAPSAGPARRTRRRRRRVGPPGRAGAAATTAERRRPHRRDRRRRARARPTLPGAAR